MLLNILFKKLIYSMKNKNKELTFDNLNYKDLKELAKKYRKELKDIKDVPFKIAYALSYYQMQPKETLIQNLKIVKKFLSK